MTSLEIQSDALIPDGAQPVTLVQKRAGAMWPRDVAGAVSGPLSNRETEALGAVGLAGTERRWSLNAAEVGPEGVLPGDVIVDGDRRWTILTAELVTLGSRWRCVARRQH